MRFGCFQLKKIKSTKKTRCCWGWKSRTLARQRWTKTRVQLLYISRFRSRLSPTHIHISWVPLGSWIMLSNNGRQTQVVHYHHLPVSVSCHYLTHVSFSLWLTCLKCLLIKIGKKNREIYEFETGLPILSEQISFYLWVSIFFFSFMLTLNSSHFHLALESTGVCSFCEVLKNPVCSATCWGNKHSVLFKTHVCHSGILTDILSPQHISAPTCVALVYTCKSSRGRLELRWTTTSLTQWPEENPCPLRHFHQDRKEQSLFQIQHSNALYTCSWSGS